MLETVTSTSKSLVMGILTSLSPSYIEPFASSLRATGFSGSFCIVTAGYSSGELKALASLADDVYEVDDSCATLTRSHALNLLRLAKTTRGLRRFYPYLFEAVARWGLERRSLDRWQSLEYRLEGLQALRYAHYYRYLTLHAPNADFVMLSDLRDVVFQRDPFEGGVQGLELYLEEEPIRVGAEHFNTRWLRDLYGRQAVSDLEGRPISCSGTVIGRRDAMLAYLAEMMMNILWRRRPMGPHDQGVHNWLIANGRLNGASLVPNGSGRVLTMGGMKTYNTSTDGCILNNDGSVPAVLHQFDRHEELAHRFYPQNV